MKYLIALVLCLFAATSPAYARGGSGRGVGRGGAGPQQGGSTVPKPTTKPNKSNTNTKVNATDYIESILREHSDSDRSDFLFSQRDKSLVNVNYEQIKTSKVFTQFH